jgi:GDPmannose 4,6-dehydratase
VGTKNALIFGAGGQDGFYLDMLLQQQGVDTVKISRSSGDVTGNIADLEFVEGQIKQHRPDYIFHFAAHSTAKHSALFDNHEAISTGTLNVLESARLHCPATRVFLSGSALQFKNEGLPINEGTVFEAGSPYAVARIQSVYAARYYRKAFGSNVFVGYFFNHDSPLRTEQHVNQKIVRAAQRIAKGSNEMLALGNIEVQKEFNFAGDMMEAVWQFVNQDDIFEIVVGSGKAYPIKDWLFYCFERFGLNWKQHVTLQEDFVPEYKILVSDPQLLVGLGWKPRVDFQQLANLMINE